MVSKLYSIKIEVTYSHRRLRRGVLALPLRARLRLRRRRRARRRESVNGLHRDISISVLANVVLAHRFRRIHLHIAVEKGDAIAASEHGLHIIYQLANYGTAIVSNVNRFRAVQLVAKIESAAPFNCHSEYMLTSPVFYMKYTQHTHTSHTFITSLLFSVVG